MKDDRIACGLCAWRGTCAKKFSKSGQVTIHCQDFTRDITIGMKKKDEQKEQKESDKGE